MFNGIVCTYASFICLGFLSPSAGLVSGANTSFTMFLLHNEPYAIKGHLSGIIPEQMTVLMRKARDININTRIVSWSLQEAKEMVASKDPLKMIRGRENITGRNFIIGAWNYHYQEENERFVEFPVAHSPGLAVIVHRDTISLSVKLYSGMKHSMLIIYNGVLMAAILGIVVLWMERRSNPMFTKDLGGGILDGVWFGVVTMTSVGYGDLVPKSKISKVMCLVFMLTSTLIVAALTSTYTEHMTHTNVDITGMQLSVVDGSRGMHVARQYKRYQQEESIHKVPTFFDALRQVNKKEVEASIIDSIVGAWCNNEVLKEELRFTKQIDKKFDVSIFIYKDASNANDVDRLLDKLEETRHDFDKVVDSYSRPIELVYVDAKDIGYAMRMLGITPLLSLTVAVVILFVLTNHLINLLKQKKQVGKDVLINTDSLNNNITRKKYPTFEDLQQRLDVKLHTIREDILTEYRDILQSHALLEDDIPKVDTPCVADFCMDDNFSASVEIPSLGFGSRVNGIDRA